MEFLASDSENYLLATSYLSLQDVTDLMTGDGYVRWTQIERKREKQKKLMFASNFIDNFTVFYGKKTSAEQILEFPRYGVTTIPINIKYATIEVLGYSLISYRVDNILEKKVKGLWVKYAETLQSSSFAKIGKYLLKYEDPAVRINWGGNYEC